MEAKMEMRKAEIVRLNSDMNAREDRMVQLTELLNEIIYCPDATRDLMAMDVIGALECVKQDYYLKSFWGMDDDE